MKERPILFNGPMVRALLGGTKTQTRRVLKCDYEITGLGDSEQWARGLAENACYGRPITEADIKEKAAQLAGRLHPVILEDGTMVGLRCPYGQPGDRLWVRETHQFDAPCDGTWAHTSFYGCKGAPLDLIPERFRHPQFCLYRAGYQYDIAWRPAIHMPRWASRITLEITNVRVERLQAISEVDSIAEGIETNAAWPGGFYRNYTLPEHSDVRSLPPRDSYLSLWQSINGRESWDANPWVWVVEFRVVKPGEVNQQGATR